MNTPPDPEAAKQIAQEAKRMHAAGRWCELLIAIGLAGVFSAFHTVFVLSGASAYTDGSSLVVIVVTASLIALGLFARHKVMQAKTAKLSRGEPHASWPSVPGWIVHASIAVALALFGVSAMLAWKGVGFGDETWLYLMAVLLFVAALALGRCALRLRHWEYALAAVGTLVAATGLLTADPVDPEQGRLFAVLLAWGLACLVAGVRLSARWRRFVASLTKEAVV